jgi:hypothetical protein
VHATHSGIFSATPGPRAQPATAAEFHLVCRGLTPIGITGYYAADVWEHIGWGGWGGLRRKFARLKTVMSLLTETEALARQRGHEWFCIETSGAPEYRWARRMYEHYGMQQLLNVEGFFQDGSTSSRGDSYVVYGRRLQNLCQGLVRV